MNALIRDDMDGGNKSGNRRPGQQAFHDFLGIGRHLGQRHGHIVRAERFAPGELQTGTVGRNVYRRFDMARFQGIDVTPFEIFQRFAAEKTAEKPAAAGRRALVVVFAAAPHRFERAVNRHVGCVVFIFVCSRGGTDQPADQNSRRQGPWVR